MLCLREMSRQAMNSIEMERIITVARDREVLLKACKHAKDYLFKEYFLNKNNNDEMAKVLLELEEAITISGGTK